MDKRAENLTDQEVMVKLKNYIMRMDEEQCAELLKYVKKVERMTDEEVCTELERLRAEKKEG